MQHTKLKRLVRALKVPQYAAVGILESLWHLTAREAPEGNIGKLSNEDIAAWIDWQGDADGLIAALVTAGWLDEIQVDRLVVHDWHEHADDATKKAIARQKEKVSGNVQTSTDKTRLPEPEPEPEPLPVPERKPEKEPIAPTAIAVPAAKLVCTLPLNDGTDHNVFEPDVQTWIPLYPAVDVRQELRSLKGWLLGNPKLRKTKTGIARFINSWLSRAQNEAKPGASYGNRNQSKTAGNVDAAKQALAILAEAERSSGAFDEVQPTETGSDESGDFSHLRAGSIELQPD